MSECNTRLSNVKTDKTKIKCPTLILWGKNSLVGKNFKPLEIWKKYANNIDGLVISNSTIERPDTLKSNLNNEIGGLSGKPLFLKSTMILRKMYILTNGQIPLIGVGGINNALECYEKIKSGASLVQLYSALTFEGPKIIHKILLDLSNLLKTDGYKSIKEAIGKDT
mgnify:CR=1 FL=1